MTSLPLNQADGFYRQFVPEWGTNQMKEKVPLWSAKSPTWHLSGEPTRQFYELTQLKKSNVRLNDQLLPKPQESVIGEDMIHKPFPAEHPYASHIPRLKMFPSYATTSEDPKRGVIALNTTPLSSETPATNFDVQILHKTKGSANRHEVQSLPQTSLRRGLTWHGDQGFHHGVKAHGDRQPYYPTPPSSVVPNVMSRYNTVHEISDKNSNATRNLERQQWKTTYDKNHTGIGPANQYKLDNLNDKQERKTLFGFEDDNIYPWFTNTYEPSRPQEGRIANQQNPNYGVPRLRGAAQDDTSYVRKPTLTEREEHRLLNGSDYVSLPAPVEGKDNQWHEWTVTNNPEERFAALIERQMRSAPDPLPFVERGTASLADNKTNYLDKLAQEHHDKIQRVEADNRWTQLEVLKPAHDIGVLDRKLAVSTPKEQVSAFYGHEGKYNEERAGLYFTSYDPAKLAYKLDDDPGKLQQRNTVGSATNAICYPTDLNLEADIIREDIQTDTRKVAMFSERPDINEVFEPFKRDRQTRLTQLMPNASNARARIQEGDVLNTSSTMGSGYNHEKFLQEYVLNQHVRNEPLALMSSQNQNLANVKANATKQVKFSDHITVGEGAGNKPLTVGKASIDTPKIVLYSPRTITPNTVRPAPSILSQSLPHRLQDVDQDLQLMRRSSEPFQPKDRNGGINGSDYLSSLTDNEKLFLSQKTKTSRNLFDSKSSNLGIGSTSNNVFKSSYDQQFQATRPKTDSYYYWEPGCGVPRPQTTLTKIQNAFSKTAVHKNLHDHFPEKNPNLIDNINKGRKHDFGSLNAQVLRGTLINA